LKVKAIIVPRNVREKRIINRQDGWFRCQDSRCAGVQLSPHAQSLIPGRVGMQKGQE